jgi:hypothetical protein
MEAKLTPAGASAPSSDGASSSCATSISAFRASSKLLSSASSGILHHLRLKEKATGALYVYRRAATGGHTCPPRVNNTDLKVGAFTE